MTVKQWTRVEKTPCNSCNESGWITCWRCKGAGELESTALNRFTGRYETKREACSTCGKKGEWQCTFCNGQGFYYSEVKYEEVRGDWESYKTESRYPSRRYKGFDGEGDIEVYDTYEGTRWVAHKGGRQTRLTRNGKYVDGKSDTSRKVNSDGCFTATFLLCLVLVMCLDGAWTWARVGERVSDKE